MGVFGTLVWMARGGVAAGKHLSSPFQLIKHAGPVAPAVCVCVHARALAHAGWDWGGTQSSYSACVDSEVKNGVCVF